MKSLPIAITNCWSTRATADNAIDDILGANDHNGGEHRAAPQAEPEISNAVLLDRAFEGQRVLFSAIEYIKRREHAYVDACNVMREKILDIDDYVTALSRKAASKRWLKLKKWLTTYTSSYFALETPRILAVDTDTSPVLKTLPLLPQSLTLGALANQELEKRQASYFDFVSCWDVRPKNRIIYSIAIADKKLATQFDNVVPCWKTPGLTQAELINYERFEKASWKVSVTGIKWFYATDVSGPRSDRDLWRTATFIGGHKAQVSRWRRLDKRVAYGENIYPAGIGPDPRYGKTTAEKSHDKTHYAVAACGRCFVGVAENPNCPVHSALYTPFICTRKHQCATVLEPCNGLPRDGFVDSENAVARFS